MTEITYRYEVMGDNLSKLWDRALTQGRALFGDGFSYKDIAVLDIVDTTTGGYLARVGCGGHTERPDRAMKFRQDF